MRSVIEREVVACGFPCQDFSATPISDYSFVITGVGAPARTFVRRSHLTAARFASHYFAIVRAHALVTEFLPGRNEHGPWNVHNGGAGTVARRI